ncbi:PqqD family peptide modification chaperone [Terriglobus sp. 2YAB30_2]|uniref:PqqD family peptide modification chaperone n=1 Tax=unclassified Terriglobus TaxID=2628988 RepID=UPI003F997A93
MSEKYLRRVFSGILYDGSSICLRNGDLQLLSLNSIGLAIWDLLEYPITITGIVARLLASYDVREAVCRRSTLEFLNELDRFGLLRHVSAPSAAEQQRSRYLHLLKRTLTNLVYPENALRISRLEEGAFSTDRKTRTAQMVQVRYTDAEAYATCIRGLRLGNPALSNRSFPRTLIGLAGLDNIEFCAEQVFADEIPGDFLEAGVWQGGASMMMRALQLAHQQEDRSVWLADTFDGLPVNTSEPDIRFGVDFSKNAFPILVAPLRTVMDNFRDLGLLDGRVRFLPGLFADALPQADTGPLALLRLDADMYSSTMDALNNLYHRVSPGGFIIVDDYGLPACREAIDEFRARHDISDPMQWVNTTCVFWRKSGAAG